RGPTCPTTEGARPPAAPAPPPHLPARYRRRPPPAGSRPGGPPAAVTSAFASSPGRNGASRHLRTDVRVSSFGRGARILSDPAPSVSAVTKRPSGKTSNLPGVAAMGAGPDREKALDLALAQIDKQFGKGSVMRLGDKPVSQVAAIPTGSIALDVALGIGGIPRGRVVEVYGPEASGKTTVTLHVVANAQAAGGIAAFIDAEHALDPEYARALGVDTE